MQTGARVQVIGLSREPFYAVLREGCVSITDDEGEFFRLDLERVDVKDATPRCPECGSDLVLQRRGRWQCPECV